MQRDAGVLSDRGRVPATARTPGVAELEQWPVLPCPPRPAGRDVALDLLRGLAMIVLVVNHAQLSSWLGVATSTLVSAAEVLVPVSGVAVGMVFGRRWVVNGARATTLQLWRRARTLYFASVTVGALVGLATFLPVLAVDAASVSNGGRELYAFDGALRTVLAVLTLEAGPWQINVLGLFVVTLLIAPALLWALHRGWWAGLLVLSAALYLLGRALDVDVLPTQSEGPFPVLVWQVL
ncbi:OpgC domain-containing protein, partial [Paraconexibacter sp.]|uniref:OpgC domain-containing protein n=1 Tax=Paraconexibacter sp. TaxID=2949640 RepID=UPI00356471E3